MCDVEYISELGGVKGKVPGLQIDVIDQGIGIPAGEHETIFNKFALSTKTATGAGGSGLGLSVCKEIMRAHHGVILALDAPGGGAIFRCILPKVAIRRLGMAD
jgi:signal transduction histidine kinase